LRSTAIVSASKVVQHGDALRLRQAGEKSESAGYAYEPGHCGTAVSLCESHINLLCEVAADPPRARQLPGDNY
jgi:hypothetical protein